jgi:hypothetical protein
LSFLRLISRWRPASVILVPSKLIDCKLERPPRYTTPASVIKVCSRFRRRSLVQFCTCLSPSSVTGQLSRTSHSSPVASTRA